MANIFSTKQYAWTDVHVVILGREMAGVRGVEYKTTQEKEAIYGRGSSPVAIQRGNKTTEGTLTVLQSELEALLLSIGRGSDVTDIAAFDIVISYVPETGGQIVTDIIKGAEFTECSKALKQNDKFMEVSLPFIALGVIFGV